MLPPANVSVIRHVSQVGIADVSLARLDSVGAVLPASDLIVVSILTRAHDVFLLPCGTVTRNIVTKSSQGVCSHWFPLCISQILQPRPGPGLCTACLPAMITLSSDRRLSLTQTFFFLASLPRLLLPFALRLHTDLHWHKIAVNALLCSRDLEVLLSHLYTARDSCAFPDGTSFDSLVLHSQHIHIRHDFIDHSLSYLCRYVVFASATQHIPQESKKPWVPFPHELPPPCESLVHTCIVTPVQCLHHHEYVVHQHAELSDESRRRRLFCTSSVPTRSAGPRLRDMISVATTNPHVSSDLCMWWSTWHSELAPQAQFSLFGESFPASLEIAEVARSTAGWPLSSAPLESTWSVGTRCFPPCSTLVSTEVAHA